MNLPNDEMQLENTFIRFACELRFADRRPFLHEHPELLTDHARGVIERMTRESDATKDYYPDLKQLQWMAVILRRAVEIGIDPAFDEYSPPNRAVWDPIIQLMRAKTIPETFRILVNHFSALNPRDVRSALLFLRHAYADNPARLQQFDAAEEAVALLNAGR